MIKVVVVAIMIFSNEMVLEECSEFWLKKINKGFAKFFTLIVKIFAYLDISPFRIQ